MSATRWTISFLDGVFTASTDVSLVTLLLDGQRPVRGAVRPAARSLQCPHPLTMCRRRIPEQLGDCPPPKICQLTRRNTLTSTNTTAQIHAPIQTGAHLLRQ